MAGKREQLETLNMWGQKLTREEGLTNTDKDNIHKDLALINERFNKVNTKAQSIFSNCYLFPSSVMEKSVNTDPEHIVKSSTNVIFTSKWGSLQLWEIIIVITSVHITWREKLRKIRHKKFSSRLQAIFLRSSGCWLTKWWNVNISQNS